VLLISMGVSDFVVQCCWYGENIVK